MKTFLAKLSGSRDLVISMLVHGVIVLLLAVAVIRVVHEAPPEFEPGEGLVQNPAPAPQPPASAAPQLTDPLRELQGAPSTFAPPDLNLIRSSAPQPWSAPVVVGVPVQAFVPEVAAPAKSLSAEAFIPRDALPAIRETAASWKRGSGKYHFTAVLARYQGGDWNSTIRMEGDRVTGGSLPNLLYLMNKWSKDRIVTNEDKVRVMRLDSDELLVQRPPFVFMTGTRDFKLTDVEVENLRKYLRMGGCIWGDSSVPGLRSRFDLAFKREMKRVIGLSDAEFQPLPADHRLFREGYFKQVSSVPAGLNHYREPVSVLRLFGEVAVIYTANDYADMWQIGLNEQGEVDVRRNARGQYVAVNPELWKYRETYLANLSPAGPSRDPARNLADTYRFGANVIFHLLTRWDEKLASAGPL